MKDLSTIDFPGKEPGEQVILLLRRHWFILFMHTTTTVLLLLAPFVLGIILRATFGDLQTLTVYPFLILGLWLYLMFIWLYFFLGWIDYYLDAWIVTNERIINIEQNGLFNRVVSEQKLYRIQDVTAEVTGTIHTLLNFGNVYIQTAAEISRFAFEDIPEPYRVKKIVLDLHDKAVDKEIERQAHIEAEFQGDAEMNSHVETEPRDQAMPHSDGPFPIHAPHPHRHSDNRNPLS